MTDPAKKPLTLAMHNANGDRLWSVVFTADLIDRLVDTATGAPAAAIALSVGDSRPDVLGALGGDVGEILWLIVASYLTRAARVNVSSTWGQP